MIWVCFLKAATEHQNLGAKDRVAPASRLFDGAAFALAVSLCIDILGIDGLVVI